jgi:hypothetical protein
MAIQRSSIKAYGDLEESRVTRFKGIFQALQSVSICVHPWLKPF